jgi:membrane fusion protein, multidrug efflux system
MRQVSKARRFGAETVLSGWLRATLFLAVGAVLAGCNSEAKVSKEIARPVKVTVVGDAARGRTLTYSGVARPRIESAVGFRVPGKIVERLVNVGDGLEVDQIIARLDDIDLKLAEQSAKAAVDSARSRRDVARDNLERGKALLRNATISQAAYDTRREWTRPRRHWSPRRRNCAKPRMRLDMQRCGRTRRASLPRSRRNPGRSSLPVKPSSYSPTGAETEIAIAVPEQDAVYFAVGQPARISLWAGPQVNIAGSIREIAGQADSASRTYAIRVSASEVPATMRFGMTASVALHIDDEAAGTVVPIAALTESDGGPVVFLVDPATETVRKTKVTVDGTTEDGVRISSGLHAGDVVVTAGVQFLRDGMAVRVPNGRQQAHGGNST